MSGHSHAKTIAHAKNITDQKRGQMFSKMARLITIAIKDGGPNLESNSKLKVAIERAKSFNMPNDNIERAIKQATGGAEGKTLTEFSFDAYGPGGIAIIIEGITDNRNRVLSDLKQILSQHGGKLAQEGSVRWMFEKKGVILVVLDEQPENWKQKEALELKVMEANAEDFSWQENMMEIVTASQDLQSVKSFLEKEGIAIKSASVDWTEKEEVPVSDQDKDLAEKLFNALDENNDVQDFSSNIKN